MDKGTQAYYDSHADEVTDCYESVSGGIASFFPFVFKGGEKVLDIGAGTGRDAAALLRLGVDVHAVEPSARLRQHALARHPGLSGRIFDGALPDRLPVETDGPYDGILVSAVLMHIPDAQLFDSAYRIRERLAPFGSLLVSIPVQRNDVAPGEARDTSGRLMILRSPAQVTLLFERLGFTLESQWRSSDALGRPGTLWQTTHFRLSGSAPRPIDRIESILNADRKVATYMLAVIRALCDVALTSWSQARWEPDGRVSLALDDVTSRWIGYYWPLVESRQMMPQINGEARGARPIAFRAALGELVEHYRLRGGLSSYLRDSGNGCLLPEAEKLSRAGCQGFEHHRQGPCALRGRRPWESTSSASTRRPGAS